jgi:CRISPR-associated protein Cmr2
MTQSNPKALFLVTLGPVQEFIASARRSRDLWFGSWLLSELSKAAANTLAQGNLDRLIFPAPESLDTLVPESPFNVTNRVLAQVEVPPSTPLHELGIQIEQAIQNRLLAIYDQTMATIRGRANLQTEAHAQAQVLDLIEIFWAAVFVEPYGYAAARARVDALVAARKNTRNFRAVTWSNHVPKSSLDGQRESVIPEDAYPDRHDTPEERTRKIAQLYLHYGAKQAERLSGVDLLKRHGNVKRRNEAEPATEQGNADALPDEARFMSTSHVAALPLLAWLDQRPATERIAAAWDRYLRIAQEEALDRAFIYRECVAQKYKHRSVIGDSDGSLLFEERLPDILEGTPKHGIRKVQGALADFLDSTLNGVRPLPYYALVHADGDNMGKAITALQDATQHRALSRALSNFAQAVGVTVEEEHHGALIYAGGDDVLALVPLHKVLQCARTLATDFRRQLEEFKCHDDVTGRDLQPTLSVGIAICHHLEPLSDALRLARQAEQTAKEDAGRNSLAITVSKRSGVDRTVYGAWGSIDQRLDVFIDLHYKDLLPDNAAYHLGTLAEQLEVSNPDGRDERTRPMLHFEAQRILERKRGQRGHRSLSSNEIQTLMTYLESPEMTIRQFADEMIVAREFARAKTLADGQYERE